MAYNQEQLKTYKAVSIIAFILSVYGGLTFSGVKENDLAHTPYSASSILLYIYWAILYIWQAVYIIQVFFPDDFRLSIVSLIGWHFPIFSILHYVWSELFTNEHYFLSEIVLIINFLNIITLYFAHKTFALRPISNYLLIHMPLVAMTMAWLFYAIFWNGAVWLQIHKVWGRIVANVFIWVFLFVPGFFLTFFNDWATGVSFTYLLFALAFGQLATKVFALQWIFAFVIAGILAIWTIGAMIVGGIKAPNGENAPLLVVEEEHVGN
ncbi:uncharacterized protein KGF55_002541 [Candida pseudojiufengensis]|uniref:uncharacterized protein n=1 Tax=Candida pseudojiufengensis TaxID=497109 RepID=UPI002225632B|nr:uncharacterized protein KGF55_002541 [Candida pseudojiufengensis]KAI5963661.1 hypothetical protein KGF55_002541 [Candida pseudojiufengensis]